MLWMYNYVDTNYDVIIPDTHNTAHVIILPLEIIIIIHYTICLTFNNHLLREGYALLECFSLLLNFVNSFTACIILMIINPSITIMYIIFCVMQTLDAPIITVYLFILHNEPIMPLGTCFLYKHFVKLSAHHLL